MLALAHALETHKTLTGEDVEAVLEGSQGLCVDGTRLRRRRTFLAQLEEYHAAAAGAHHNHTGVRLALPAGGRRTLPEAAGADTAAATPHDPRP